MLSWPAKPLKAASRNSLDPALTNVSWSRAPRIVRETIEGIWTTQNPKTPRPAFEGRARDILAEARDSAARDSQQNPSIGRLLQALSCHGFARPGASPPSTLAQPRKGPLCPTYSLPCPPLDALPSRFPRVPPIPATPVRGGGAAYSATARGGRCRPTSAACGWLAPRRSAKPDG